jgi:hypothetical protein
VQKTKYGEEKTPSERERIYAKRYGSRELFRKLDAREAGIEVQLIFAYNHYFALDLLAYAVNLTDLLWNSIFRWIGMRQMG